MSKAHQELCPSTVSMKGGELKTSRAVEMRFGISPLPSIQFTRMRGQTGNGTAGVFMNLPV
jgi:hypothetical protein